MQPTLPLHLINGTITKGDSPYLAEHHHLPRYRVRGGGPRKWYLLHHDRWPGFLYRQYHATHRLFRLILLISVTVLAIAGLRRRFEEQHALAIKRIPTDFASLSSRSLQQSEPHLQSGSVSISGTGVQSSAPPPATSSTPSFWSPPHPLRRRATNSHDIGDRYTHVRHLGAGREGSADLYIDASDNSLVVIKEFTGVSRNALPPQLAWEFADYTDRWPTEIEAGVLLQGTVVGNLTAYAAVKDYFVLRTGDGSSVDDGGDGGVGIADEGSTGGGKMVTSDPEAAATALADSVALRKTHSHDHWNWAMVSPHFSSGTLLDFGVATRRENHRSVSTLDARFRPVLNRLLQTLQQLHEADLCHDDVKPDNLFVQAPEHWLLGDLGNIRHVDHPWHSQKLWKRQNQWDDCRLNDVRRLLKAYLAFLRLAAGDAKVFDRDFWEGREGWSRLYWTFDEVPRSAGEMLEVSGQLEEEESRGYGVNAYEMQERGRGDDEKGESLLKDRGVGPDQACLARKTELELTCTTLQKRMSDWWVLRGC